MAVTVPPDLSLFPLSVERYERMVDEGILGEDDPVELLRGVLVEMTPQGEEHASAIEWLTMAFASVGRANGFSVRVQSPMRFTAALSVPEPDLAIVSPDRRGHPETAFLAIEVAVSSRAKDLGAKAALYAEAGVPELWVVDLPGRTVHVHREPTSEGYAAVEQRTGGALTPSDPRIPSIDLDEFFAFAFAAP